MLDPNFGESAHFCCGPSESHDEWISRITVHPLSDHEKEVVDVLSALQATEIINRIESIFLLGANEKEDNLDIFDNDEINFKDQKGRSEKLMGILPILAQLWWLNSEQLDIATEKLANGSRDTKWRIPLGESLVFKFFLEILTRHELRPSLKTHILRLIGNSCADTDENRARITASRDYFIAIMKQLKHTAMLPFVLPVLFNICVDYVPNQLLASKSFLTRELIILITNPTLDKSQPFLEYVCRILTLLISQPLEIECAPENIVAVLFKIAADNKSPVQFDDFISLVNVAVCYLQHEKFQKAFVSAHGSLDNIITVLVDSYARYEIQSAATEDDDVKALKSMRASLIQVLSDVSALSEFTEACPISSQFSNTLQQWLVAPCPKNQFQVCASVMLGNLARSDTTCIKFVQTLQLHKPLIKIASTNNSSQVLHATLGFLKNLAIPLENKKKIGEERTFHVLSRVWALDSIPQVQFSAISLARQLTVGTLENVYRLIHDSLPNKTGTIFSSLCSLFTSTDNESIKMEIARLTASIYRVLYSQTGPSCEMIRSTRTQFFQMYPETTYHLKFIVSQSKWLVIRSEGWFVLALTARFPEGAAFVCQLLQDPKFFKLLTEVVMGDLGVDTSISNVSLSTSSNQDSVGSSHLNLNLNPEPVKPHVQEAEMLRLDRENTLVLVSEILKNSSSEISVQQNMKLKDLLKGGGESLMSCNMNKVKAHENTI